MMNGEWGSYECLHGEDNEQPDTGADTQGIENRWWAVKQRITRTGTPKELSNPLAGVLTMWRRHYGEVLFGNIAKHIAELYDVGNDA